MTKKGTTLTTPRNRKRVAVAAGGGMEHEEIAIALGVSRAELERLFQRELSRGAYERRLEVIEAMYEAAKRGSVSAAKLYTQAAVRLSLPPLAAPAPKLGKKAQADADAKTATEGTEWHGLLDQPAH